MLGRKPLSAKFPKYSILVLLGILSIYLLTGCGVSSPGPMGYVKGYLYKEVTRATGETVNMPIAGAILQQVGTTNKATTDAQGYFLLRGEAGTRSVKVTKSVSGLATMLGYFDIRIDSDTTTTLSGPLIIRPEFDVVSISDPDAADPPVRSLKRADAIKSIPAGMISPAVSKSLLAAKDIGVTQTQWFEVSWSGAAPTSIRVGDELYDSNPASYDVSGTDGFTILYPSGATAGNSMYFTLVEGGYGTTIGPIKSTPMALQNPSDVLNPYEGESIDYNGSLDFSWETIPGAKYYYVRMYRTTGSGDLISPITESPASPVYGLEYSYSGSLAPGDYAWWVVGVNDDDSAISLGKTVKFHIY